VNAESVPVLDSENKAAVVEQLSQIDLEASDFAANDTPMRRRRTGVARLLRPRKAPSNNDPGKEKTPPDALSEVSPGAAKTLKVMLRNTTKAALSCAAETVPFGSLAVVMFEATQSRVQAMKENKALLEELNELVALIAMRLPDVQRAFSRPGVDQRMQRKAEDLFNTAFLAFRLVSELHAKETAAKGNRKAGAATAVMRFLKCHQIADAIKTLKAQLQEAMLHLVFLDALAPTSAAALREEAPCVLTECLADDAVVFWHERSRFGQEVRIQTLLDALQQYAKQQKVLPVILYDTSLAAAVPDLVRFFDPSGQLDAFTNASRFVSFLDEAPSICAALEPYLAQAEATTNTERSNVLIKLRAALEPVDFNADVACHNKNFVDGTRTWAFKKIEEWVALPEDNPKRRLLLIRGGPGSGKSALVAQCMSRYGSPSPEDGTGGAAMQTVSHFFFQHNKDDEYTPRKLLATLAYDLARSQPKVRQSLRKNLAEVKATLGDLQCDLGQLFDVLILRPVCNGPIGQEAKQKLSKSRSRAGTARDLETHIRDSPAAEAAMPKQDLLVVIDALDEMPNDNQKTQFYMILEHQVRKLPSHFRFIVTSRFIDEANKLGSNCHQMELHHDRDDIELFALHKIIEPTTLQFLSSEEKEEVVSLIQKCSDGVVLAAQLAFSEIHRADQELGGRGLTIGDVRHLLEVDITSTGTNFIYREYKKMLDRVDDRIRQSAGEDQIALRILRRLKKQLLGALVVAKDSLQREDLAQLATGAALTKPELIKDLSEALALLLARPEPGAPLTLIHKTVHEFLLDKEAAGKHVINEMEGHATMAVSCLRLLKANNLLEGEKCAVIPGDKAVAYAAHYGHRHLTDVLKLKAKSCDKRLQYRERRAHIGGWFIKDPPKWRRYVYYAKRRTRYFVMSSDAGSVEYFKRAFNSKGDPITRRKKILIKDISSESFDETRRRLHLHTAKRIYKLEPMSNVQGKIWKRALHDLREQDSLRVEVRRKAREANERVSMSGSLASAAPASVAGSQWSTSGSANADANSNAESSDGESEGSGSDDDTAAGRKGYDYLPATKSVQPASLALDSGGIDASYALELWAGMFLKPRTKIQMPSHRPVLMAGNVAASVEEGLGMPGDKDGAEGDADGHDHTAPGNDLDIEACPSKMMASEACGAWLMLQMETLGRSHELASELRELEHALDAWGIDATVLHFSPLVRILSRLVRAEWAPRRLSAGFKYKRCLGMCLESRIPFTSELRDSPAIEVIEAWMSQPLRLRHSFPDSFGLAPCSLVLRHAHRVCAVAWSRDDQFLATGVHGEAVRVWDKNTGVCINRTYIEKSTAIQAMSWKDKGFLLVGMDTKEGAKLVILEEEEGFNGVTPSSRRELKEENMLIKHVALSPVKAKATRIAIVSRDKQIASDDPGKVTDCLALHVINLETGERFFSHNLNADDAELGAGPVTALTFSACGTILALLRPDCELQLLCLDPKPIKTTHRFAKSDESDGASCVTWSCDGKDNIAVGMKNGSLRIWAYSDVDATCHYVLSLLGHSRQVSCVAWASKDTYLASGSLDRTVRLWEVDSGACLAVLNGHQDGILCVAWSSLQDQVASGSRDRTARVWDVEKHGAFTPLQSSQTDSILAISMSPLYQGRRWLAAATKNGLVRVYDVINGGSFILSGHKASVTSLCWQWQNKAGEGSPVLATVSMGSQHQFRRQEGRIRLWRYERYGLGLPEAPKKVTVEAGKHLVLSWSASGVLACGGGDSGSLFLITEAGNAVAETKKTVRPPAGVNAAIRSLAWSPDGVWLAVGYLVGGLFLLSGENCRSFSSNAFSIGPTDIAVRNVSWSGTGALLASLTVEPEGRGTNVFIYDMSRPERPSQISQLSAMSMCDQLCTGLAWLPSPTEEVLCTADAHERLVFWRRGTEGDRDRRQMASRTLSIVSAASRLPSSTPSLSSKNTDAAMLCSLSPTNDVLWEAERLQGNFGDIQHLAWSDDGCLLASVSADQIVRVWERLDPAESDPSLVFKEGMASNAAEEGSA
jgi:WD40 repeat protein